MTIEILEKQFWEAIDNEANSIRGEDVYTPLEAIVIYIRFIAGQPHLKKVVENALSEKLYDTKESKAAREMFRRVGVEMQSVSDVAVKDYRERYHADEKGVGASNTNKYSNAVKFFSQTLEGSTGADNADKEQVILISSNGIGVSGSAERHYSVRGGRKKIIDEMYGLYPEPLSAKAWAKFVGKNLTVLSDAVQQVSADVSDINKRFKKQLQIENDLIINRNGYLLNFEELDIQKKD